MLLTLLFLIILISGIIVLYYTENDSIIAGATFMTLFSCIILSIFVIVILRSKIYVGSDYNIQKTQIEYENIVCQVETVNADYENISKIEVIEKVYEWNKYVYSYKHHSNNLWTNWFYNKKYANSLEYIELEKR